jgi:hypothetical protein
MKMYRRFRYESGAEYSEHGEEYSDSDIDTPDMLDGNGKPILSKAMMTTEHADRLRRHGSAEGSDTVSGARREEV